MENNYKRGDRVEVRDSVYDEWEPAIYLTTIEGAKFPIHCVHDLDENEFMDGKEFEVTSWKQIQPLTPKYIMIGGKKYNKEELLKAINKLTPIQND